MRGKIIVFGILFWYPLAGVTYQFLHYLIGLRRLGYDPYYIEDSARWIYDPHLNDLSPDASRNIAAVVPALQAHGFSDRWAFRGKYPDGRCYGLTESQVDQLYRDADAFLNITGAQELREEHMICKRRIYVESDPFASQVKVALGNEGMIKTLAAHDTLFSFGENLGAPDCGVPIIKFQWLPTRQPVAMELWADPPAISGSAGNLLTPVATMREAPAPYNTITTWHNKGKNIEYGGDTWYWTKDREFEKFLTLPQRAGRPPFGVPPLGGSPQSQIENRKSQIPQSGRAPPQFELAATVDEPIKNLLRSHGWRQVDSLEISRDVERYRQYIGQSRGEFTVARDQYVRPKTGWFSDRSACYLAAGRPVITQETGFSKFLPTGKGLFSFTAMDDILRAVDCIESDYEGNCRAARSIAAEYFAAEKVVGSLMQRAGL